MPSMSRALVSLVLGLLSFHSVTHAETVESKLNLGGDSSTFEVQKVITGGGKVGVLYKNVVFSQAPSTNLSIYLTLNAPTEYPDGMNSSSVTSLMFSARTSEMDLDLSPETKARLGIDDIADLDKVLSVDIVNKAVGFVRYYDDDMKIQVLSPDKLELLTYETNGAGLDNISVVTDPQTGIKYEIELKAKDTDYDRCNEKGSIYTVKNLSNGKVYELEHFGSVSAKRGCESYVKSIYKYNSSLFIVVQSGFDSYMAKPFITSVHLDMFK